MGGDSATVNMKRSPGIVFSDDDEGMIQPLSLHKRNKMQQLSQTRGQNGIADSNSRGKVANFVKNGAIAEPKGEASATNMTLDHFEDIAEKTVQQVQSASPPHPRTPQIEELIEKYENNDDPIAFDSP